MRRCPRPAGRSTRPVRSPLTDMKPRFACWPSARPATPVPLRARLPDPAQVVPIEERWAAARPCRFSRTEVVGPKFRRAFRGGVIRCSAPSAVRSNCSLRADLRLGAVVALFPTCPDLRPVAGRMEFTSPRGRHPTVSGYSMNDTVWCSPACARTCASTTACRSATDRLSYDTLSRTLYRVPGEALTGLACSWARRCRLFPSHAPGSSSDLLVDLRRGAGADAAGVVVARAAGSRSAARRPVTHLPVPAPAVEPPSLSPPPPMEDSYAVLLQNFRNTLVVSVRSRSG